MTPQRIAVLGNFGRQNLGNDCVLLAVVENLSRLAPDVPVYAICGEPVKVTAAFGVPAVPFTGMDAGRATGTIARLWRLVTRLPRELARQAASYRTLAGTGTLLVAGTGMLEDDTGALGQFLEMLRWTAAARMRRCRVVFLSVGAGPVHSRAARMLARAILRLTHDVSYRDQLSLDYMAGIGVDTARHRVEPDLAFSLPSAHLGTKASARMRTVGIGVMDGSRLGEAAYRAYLEKLRGFGVWLLDHGYDLRILHGDARYDRDAAASLHRLIGDAVDAAAAARVVLGEIALVPDLLREIAATDLVVASRYHNVLLALLSGRPAIALFYHPKHVAVMREFGLGEFCQDLATFDGGRLVSQFEALVRSIDSVRPLVARSIYNSRLRLDAQYARVLAQRAHAP